MSITDKWISVTIADSEGDATTRKVNLEDRFSHEVGWCAANAIMDHVGIHDENVVKRCVDGLLRSMLANYEVNLCYSPSWLTDAIDTVGVDDEPSQTFLD